ncbi:hypothetical protein BN14_11165 [Rhizoctonia solani AG-1 IB]|uniref:Uncharacterized protein n=1 Tax=Thanatephorus cucumeris (strain AG1-IB / isolate 7/3/14) TaxID=1108050 RepID=M5CD08_THACB|nr:hypothetical protein BN14_11165 [Rhizoctonia solani AG-1 IB]
MTLRPVRSTHKPLSITRKPLAFSADKDVVLDADVDAEIPMDKAKATNLLPIETNHPSPMIPVLGQEEALRFLGMHLNDLQDWAAPGGVANHPNKDPNANAPESVPPIACSPIQVSPTNLPPTEPASAVPPEPPIDHQLLRDLGYHADHKGLGDTIRPDSRSGQQPGGGTGFVVPGDNDVTALISAYPPHVIHTYQEAWRLTQEFNNSFGFGFGTGLGAQALGPLAGIGDFLIHRQSVEDHQLQTFKDASEQASVAAPPTPLTVQGDLPQGSHHCSPGGLSLSVPLKHLIIADSEMQDTGPCSPAPNPDTRIQSAPKLVLDPIGTAKQTDKDSQLGGAEVQGAETDRKGEGKGDGKCVLDGNNRIRGGEGQGKRSGVSTKSVTNSHEKDKET